MNILRLKMKKLITLRSVKILIKSVYLVNKEHTVVALMMENEEN